MLTSFGLAIEVGCPVGQFSDACLYAPLESPDAQHGVVVVGFLESLEQHGGLFVCHDGDEG